MLTTCYDSMLEHKYNNSQDVTCVVFSIPDFGSRARLEEGNDLITILFVKIAMP